MVSKPLLIAGFVLGLVGLTSATVAHAVDCNGNGIDDACDLDCGPPGGPCDVPGCGGSVDCNANGIPDECDVTPIQEAKLAAADAAAGDQFGASVSMSGDTAVIGATGDDSSAFNTGSVYVFVRTAGVWTQEAKLTAADAALADGLGNSVSISGDTVVVGAYQDDDAGTDSGSAYVFVRSADVWIQQAKLTAADAATRDFFGWSVSVSGDTAVIGAYQDDDAGSWSGSAYVFVRTAGVWNQQAKLTADDATSSDQFGRSVSISDETAVIGSFFDDDGGTNSGSAYVFVRTGPVWTQQAKLTAADAAAGELFGSSVSISGDTAVIGAYRDDDAGDRSGSAYVFVRTAGIWTQQAKFTAADAADFDEFGRYVSISGDKAVIGAAQNDDAGSASGSAYVFVRSGTVWTQQTKLTAADAAAGDLFGVSVSISGETALIGASFDDDAGSFSGSAYVFSALTASNDCQLDGLPDECQLAGNDCNTDGIPDECQLVANDCNANGIPDECDIASGASQDCNANGIPDECDIAGGASQDCQANGIPDECDIANGTSLDNLPVGGDGIPDECQLDCNENLIPDADDLSGGTSDDCNFNGIPDECDISGGVSQDCNANGIPDECDVNFTQHSKFIAADGAAGDQFGISVSHSSDTAIIGAWGDDDAGALSGSAYVYVQSGGVWTQQAKVTADDVMVNDRFGFSVSLSGDTVVIGKNRNEDMGPDPGSAYVFVRSGGVWSQEAKLIASDGAGGDVFGYSVSLSGDTAVIGSALDDDAGFASGSAYVFVRSGTVWTQQAKLTASDAAANDLFGFSVTLSGNTAVLGAYQDSDAGSASGSAYVFVRTDGMWTQQAKLTAADGAASDNFGRSVSLSGDTAVIGAWLDDDAGFSSGSAYVFVRTGTVWAQQAKLTAADAAAGDLFGNVVSLSGERVVIGSHGDDDAGSSSGSAYVFARAAGVWTQQVKLIADDGAAVDTFGFSVSLSGDTAFIGAWLDDDAGSDSGSAYVFSMISFDENGNGNPDECDTVGDFDGDGVFSTDDLIGFVDNLLNPGGTILGDFDGNGLADGQDIPLAVACLVDGICP